MASYATLHHITHVSSAHTSTLHSTSHPVNSPIGGSTHPYSYTPTVHSFAKGELHPSDFPHSTGYPTNHSTTPTPHSLGMDHKGGDLNLHVNDKGYSIGGKDCFGNAHDTICVGGNYSNTWGSHANGGGMASITWSHQW